MLLIWKILRDFDILTIQKKVSLNIETFIILYSVAKWSADDIERGEV